MTVVVALLATLAACAGSSHAADPSSPVPITTTPVRSTGTTSASPTLDPNSDAAIIAGVRAYAAGVTAAGKTASLTPLAAVVDADCPCLANMRSVVQELRQKQEHLDAVIRVTSARIDKRSATNADVSAVLTNSAYHVLSKDGQIVKTAAAGSSQTTISLVRKSAQWYVFYAD